MKEFIEHISDKQKEYEDTLNRLQKDKRTHVNVFSEGKYAEELVTAEVIAILKGNIKAINERQDVTVVSMSTYHVVSYVDILQRIRLDLGSGGMFEQKCEVFLRKELYSIYKSFASEEVKAACKLLLK